MMRYSLAKISFSLEGSGALVDAIGREFAGFEDDSDARPAHLRVRFVDALSPIDAYILMPPLKAGDGVYAVEQGALSFQVRAVKPGYEVSIRAEHSVGARDILDAVFDPILQFVHLENDTTFLPASSFEKDGRAVALVGWDAASESTVLLEQMGENGWHTLSDDLALINRNAIISPNRGHSGQATKLTDLFIIERAPVANFKLRSTSVPDAARQCTARLLGRLHTCVAHSAALHGASYFPILPSPDDFYQNCFNIIRQGFAVQHPSLLSVPLQAGAEDLARFLSQKLRA